MLRGGLTEFIKWDIYGNTRCNTKSLTSHKHWLLKCQVLNFN